MNRSIHLRVSDAWYDLATNRAERLGLNLSEYIRSTIAKDCEEGHMGKNIWILITPDNEHYDEKFAQEEISRLSKRWNVKAVSTSQTRDSGHGQERLFIVSGEPEAVNEFEKELEEALY
jgi:hypothetical protein